jgi:uncharacterized cupin superfamily protein
MVPAASLRHTEHGLVPDSEGWFVLNARDARWSHAPGRTAVCEFEGDGAAAFAQLGVNLSVLEPGQAMARYHWEADEEDFLVLSGEALLIVEGQERPLRAWDFIHCPPRTGHVLVGAGTGPSVVLAVGARERSTGEDWGAYPADATAARHGASAASDTAVPAQAYAGLPQRRSTAYRPGWLPG